MGLIKKTAYKLHWGIAYLAKDNTWHQEMTPEPKHEGGTVLEVFRDNLYWRFYADNRKDITGFTQVIPLQYGKTIGRDRWGGMQQIDTYKQIRFYMHYLKEETELFGILYSGAPDVSSEGHTIKWSLTFDYEDKSKNKVYSASFVWYPDNNGRSDGKTKLVVPIPEDHNWEYFIFSFDSYD